VAGGADRRIDDVGVDRLAKQYRAGDMTDAFPYAELDEILRGTGHSGAIGMSAIEGVIAALVAAPRLVHPAEWMPLILGGRKPPLDESSPELRAVKRIFNRCNEVSGILADQPRAYRPIFMIDDDGSVVVRDRAVGFAPGIGLRPKEWGESILLTRHRQVLIPILVYCEGEGDLLPEMTAAEKRRRQAAAHQQIAQAVASARDIRDPCRAAEAHRQPATGQTTPRDPSAPIAAPHPWRPVKPNRPGRQRIAYDSSLIAKAPKKPAPPKGAEVWEKLLPYRSRPGYQPG
jgi:yecA family protein